MAPRKSKSSASSLQRTVSFIPAQLDSLAATSPPSANDSPLKLAWRDVRTISSMITYLPWVIIPFWTSCADAELYMHGSNLLDLLAIGTATLLAFVLSLLAIPAFVIMPGGLITLVLGLGTALIHGICMPIQGPMIVHSKLSAKTKKLANRHSHERWIFLNGCAVGGVGLQMNCDRLSQTFNRPVMGIHNRTYGLLGDLVECIIQRSFKYSTEDCRYAYDHVKACLADPSVRKVVLIGHSQGGIIVSMILDTLFSDLPAENISKLEVYTFGSAASHFNNPLHVLKPLKSSSRPQRAHTFPTGEDELKDPEHVIKHIEHYCNVGDMVTRWGVLHSVKDLTSNRFAGKVFVHMKASGHMFNQHYLSNMFPIEGDAGFGQEGGFLDHDVDVDEDTADKREADADVKLGIRRQETLADGLEFGDGQEIELSVLEKTVLREERGKINIVGHESIGDSGGKGGVETQIQEKGADRKTVRDLSRLWRYVGGRDPDEDMSPLLVKKNGWPDGTVS